MELPITARGNQYVIIFQDLFTKWPIVFPAPDQKAKCIARLLVEEIPYKMKSWRGIYFGGLAI